MLQDWLNLEFTEAVDYFRNKEPKADPGLIQRLREGYHDSSFSVAGLARGDFATTVHSLLLKALRNGEDFDTFQANFEQKLQGGEWKPDGARLQVIFETNIRRSHAAGRYRQASEIIDQRPFWLWRHRDSVQPRDHHKALHNKAIPADHPFWKTAIPPCGYGCRCTFFAVTEEYVRRIGAQILDNPPDPLTIAEPGFRGVPTNQAKLIEQILTTGGARQAPGVKEKFQEEFKK